MVRTAKRRPIRNPFLARADYAPIAAINTTPLIDMMLVILIMLIVAIPLTNHKVALDLPPPEPGRTTPPPSHRLTIDAAGALAWDGRPLADADLPGRLARLNADPRRPALVLDAHGETRYARFDALLATIRRARVTRLGFFDNRRFAETLDRVP